MDTRINYSIADDIYEAVARENKPRKYLGMSEVGNPCDRFLWLKFRRFSKIPMENRIYLLFRFGDKVEELVCTYLRAAGYKLESAWPDPQAAYSALGGILHGHSDGIIYIPEGKALLEVKSANRKRFQSFTLGGIRATDEKYYWQCQLYMGFGGLDRALFVILNKDDSSIYTEIVPFNKTDFEWQVARVRNICTSPIWPEAKDLPECGKCDFRLHCKTTEAIQTEHNCMTCSFLDVRIGNEATLHCRHLAHQLQIHHPEMSCHEYSWVGTCPF